MPADETSFTCLFGQQRSVECFLYPVLCSRPWTAAWAERVLTVRVCVLCVDAQQRDAQQIDQTSNGKCHGKKKQGTFSEAQSAQGSCALFFSAAVKFTEHDIFKC